VLVSIGNFCNENWTYHLDRGRHQRQSRWLRLPGPELRSVQALVSIIAGIFGVKRNKPAKRILHPSSCIWRRSSMRSFRPVRSLDVTRVCSAGKIWPCVLAKCAILWIFVNVYEFTRCRSLFRLTIMGSLVRAPSKK
jgi:hypothetical protein